MYTVPKLIKMEQNWTKLLEK